MMKRRKQYNQIFSVRCERDVGKITRHHEHDARRVGFDFFAFRLNRTRIRVRVRLNKIYT